MSKLTHTYIDHFCELNYLVLAFCICKLNVSPSIFKNNVFLQFDKVKMCRQNHLFLKNQRDTSINLT